MSGVIIEFLCLTSVGQNSLIFIYHSVVGREYISVLGTVLLLWIRIERNRWILCYRIRLLEFGVEKIFFCGVNVRKSMYRSLFCNLMSCLNYAALELCEGLHQESVVENIIGILHRNLESWHLIHDTRNLSTTGRYSTYRLQNVLLAEC